MVRGYCRNWGGKKTSQFSRAIPAALPPGDPQRLQTGPSMLHRIISVSQLSPTKASASRDTSVTDSRGHRAAGEGTCVLRTDEGHLVGVRLQADEAAFPVHRLPRVRVEGVEPGGHQSVSAGAAREQGTACSLTWKQLDKGHHGGCSGVCGRGRQVPPDPHLQHESMPWHLAQPSPLCSAPRGQQLALCNSGSPSPGPFWPPHLTH